MDPGGPDSWCVRNAFSTSPGSSASGLIWLWEKGTLVASVTLAEDSLSQTCSSVNPPSLNVALVPGKETGNHGGRDGPRKARPGIPISISLLWIYRRWLWKSREEGRAPSKEIWRAKPIWHKGTRNHLQGVGHPM